MKLREAKKIDANDVVKLVLGVNTYERQFDSTLRKFSKEKTRKWFFKKLKDRNSKIFVASDKGKVVAFCSGCIMKKPTFFTIKYAGYCDDLFVLPSYRRRGIAKELLNNLLMWFKSKKIKYFEIESYANNDVAIKAYHSFGFKDYLLKLRKVIL